MITPKKRFKTIDEYIKSFPKDVGTRLKTIKEIVKECAPQAQEVISYNMPAFKLNGVLVYFAAYKDHIGLYPYPSAIKEFKTESAKYKTSTGSIQFPKDKPLPLPLIRKIVKYRVKESLAKKNK
jgi:uncharacterized protein YdhG (YjbR/CyaY superfamily)